MRGLLETKGGTWLMVGRKGDKVVLFVDPAGSRPRWARWRRRRQVTVLLTDEEARALARELLDKLARRRA